MVVFQPPDVLAGDCPAEMRDGQASVGTSRYLIGLARAESPADKPGDGLAQRLMGIFCDLDRLSMKIIRDVEGNAHSSNVTSLHQIIRVVDQRGHGRDQSIERFAGKSPSCPRTRSLNSARSVTVPEPAPPAAPASPGRLPLLASSARCRSALLPVPRSSRPGWPR
jgi:hypothetical protein